MNNKNKKVLKTTVQQIRERKEKRRLKTDRFINKLEKLEKAKELVPEQPPKSIHPAKVARKFTISIALPCSVINACLTWELKCFLAGTIARCATIFHVDEIIIFNDTLSPIPMTIDGNYALNGKHAHGVLMLATILQYMECPPYIRKFFFPFKKEFELINEICPLNIPHHHYENDSLYREGVVSKTTPKPGKGSYVFIGSHREVQVDRLLEEGVRVTVKMDPSKNEKQKKLNGTIVAPSLPRTESSIYWGYSVRIAESFSQIFENSPFSEKYDLTVGTSAQGTSVDDVRNLKPFKHALIVFGGLHGIDAIIEGEEQLPASDAKALFDLFLNTCPNQGSRMIRTEEALFITLASLQSKFN